ncbi:T9SS type A sorting domain-containing protein [Daejeonella oryzae]|uniref:T9SS type A sorting domain-containing protein n=1 Tax=Daejeonella oryzae TaxID=1122943 RepID=UPI00041ADE34|nr:T9SS type A sorting domain-containing protein [Daejeonella oryzae]
MRSYSRFLILFIFSNIIFSANSYLQAASISIITDTNWSNITSGSGAGGKPTAADFVTVKNNASLTIDVSNATCLSLTVGEAGANNGEGFLVFKAGSVLTVVNDIILGKNEPKFGSLDMTLGGTLRVGQSFTAPDLGEFTPGLGTIEYYGTYNQPILGTAALVNNYYNLIISGGVTKTLTSSVNVTGNLTVQANTTLNSNNFLTLTSNANSNAGIGPLLNGAVVSGNVKVESWFTGGNAPNNAMRGTRTVSSPINDTSTPSVFEQLKNYMFITGNGSGFEPAPAPNSPTILKYNETVSYGAGASAQYLNINSTSSKSTPGLGFFLFYRGNRSNLSGNKLVPVNGSYAIPESFAVTYTGPINQGSVNVPSLSYTYRTEHPNDAGYNGYNLVGNPYPSTINWNSSGIIKSNIEENLISVIKPGGGMITYSNGVTTNGGPPLTDTYGTSPISTNLPYIQTGQGFYIKAKGPGAFVTFTENCKAVNNSPARLLTTSDDILMSTSNSVNEMPSDILRIFLQDSQNQDETAIVFNDNYLAEYGDADAIYFNGSTVSLSSLSADGKNLAINFMPSLKAVDEIKLAVNGTASGNLKLIFTEIPKNFAGEIVLKDEFLNTLTNLKITPVYEFLIDKSNQNTFGSNRFKVIFQPALNPEMTILNFSALKIQSNIDLSWEISNQVNTSYYIEKSTDSLNYSVIGTINAQNSSTLNFVFSDTSPNVGLNYYRLRYVTLDGKTNYSKTIPIYLLDKQSDSNFSILLFPNPASDEIKILLSQNTNPFIQLSVFNINGQHLSDSIISSINPIKLNVNHLKDGVYLLKISEPKSNKFLGSVRFIVGKK